MWWSFPTTKNYVYRQRKNGDSFQRDNTDFDWPGDQKVLIYISPLPIFRLDGSQSSYSSRIVLHNVYFRARLRLRCKNYINLGRYHRLWHINDAPSHLLPYSGAKKCRFLCSSRCCLPFPWTLASGNTGWGGYRSHKQWVTTHIKSNLFVEQVKKTPKCNTINDTKTTVTQQWWARLKTHSELKAKG